MGYAYVGHNSSNVRLYFQAEGYVTAGTPTQGSTSYGYVSSTSRYGYPDNSYSGSYWYTYKGSDSIDPGSVTYSANSIQPGDSITIQAAASSKNVYGGTISYRYEYSTDGGTTWKTAGTTTAKSYSVIRKGEARIREVSFDTLVAGDIFFCHGQAITAGEDAHYSRDASYDGYLLYDTEGDSWFPGELDSDVKPYVISKTEGSQFYMPEALHIEKNDNVFFVKNDAHAVELAKSDGVKLIFDMDHVVKDVYLDTPLNRNIILWQLQKHPEYMDVGCEKAKGPEMAPSSSDVLFLWAAAMDKFCFDHDSYEYFDRIEDREAAIEENLNALRDGNTDHIRAYLMEFIEEGRDPAAIDEALILLSTMPAPSGSGIQPVKKPTLDVMIQSAEKHQKQSETGRSNIYDAGEKDR